ncbi:hypothetical protein C8J56DRAFT_889415 [Mycena floridula]|nr:hypothetical protein C8J56DRAFT_889415 [Mycena floridula]
MPPGPPGSAQIYGPMLVGAFLSTVLYDVHFVYLLHPIAPLTSAFISRYSSTTEREKGLSSLPLGLLPFLMFCQGSFMDTTSQTANTCFNVALVYEPLVINFGEEQVLTTSPACNVAYHLLKKADSSEKVRSSAKTKLEGWQVAEPAPGAAPSSVEGNISNHLDSILQTP